MAKKKGKHKGSPGGLNFEMKAQLEKELQQTLFNSGRKGSQHPDPGLGEGSSSANLDGGGDTQDGPYLGQGEHQSCPDLMNGHGGGSSSAPSPPDLNKAADSEWRTGSESGNGTRTVRTEGGPRFTRPLSFAQVARGSRRGAIAERLRFLPGINGDCITYTSEDVADAGKAWAATLVGAVMGPVVPTGVIVQALKSQWKVKFRTFFIKPSGIFVFKFDREEDLTWVMEHGPWAIGTSPLLLKPWIVGSSMDWGSFKTVPVWVRLMDVPSIFCSNSMLSRIGSGILCIDEFTSNQEMVSFARMLIEIDVDQAKRKHVLLRNERGTDYSMKTIFEWLPWHCTRCCCFGHTYASCPISVIGKEPPVAGTGSDEGVKMVADSTIELKSASNHGNETAAIRNDPIVDGSLLLAVACPLPHVRSLAATTSIGIQTDQGEFYEFEEVIGGRELVKLPIDYDKAADIKVSVINAATQTDCVLETGKAGKPPIYPPAQRAQSRKGADDDVAALKADPVSSKVCAALVANAWAEDSGLSVTRNGRMRLNGYRTPSSKRWQEVSGVKKGSYLLQGTSNSIPGDTCSRGYPSIPGIKLS